VKEPSLIIVGVINMISEHFVEAANASSINAPYGVSEWDLTGLHPAPCTHVKSLRVKESIFATECKLVEIKEFESRTVPGKKTGALVILEGVNFWVREDAINEDKNMIDPAVCFASFLYNLCAILIS
jgi:flavin reductase (DIM6/NTAB) family NADH-FMN oxidoreductase RutF